MKITLGEISAGRRMVYADGKEIGYLKKFCCGVDFNETAKNGLFSIGKLNIGDSAKLKECVRVLIELKRPSKSFHWNFSHEIATNKELLEGYQQRLLEIDKQLGKSKKPLVEQIIDAYRPEAKEAAKPKPKRQRKYMELSVYNKLIDNLKGLRSDNKRLKNELAELQEVYQREKAWGIEWYFKATHDPKQDLTIHQILGVGDEIEELKSQNDLLNSQVETMKPIVESHEYLRNKAFVYQGLSIMLFVALVLVSIFAAW